MSVTARTLPNSIKSDLSDWFATRAPGVDRAELSAHDGLPYLAERELLAKGVPTRIGGDGDGLDTMIEVIATVAEQCLTSAFVLWSHRSLIGLLASSDNNLLHERLLPDLLTADQFGSTGLANALKYAASLEELTVYARSEDADCYTLTGTIPWASNLIPGRFAIAVAAGRPDGNVLLSAVASTAPGLALDRAQPLFALDGTTSGSLRLQNVKVDLSRVISDDGMKFLAAMRPQFLLLQCGLPWGVAQAAITSASANSNGAKASLAPLVGRLRARFDQLTKAVRSLSRKPTFSKKDLYDVCLVRLQLTELAADAVWLELEAAGGAGYVASSATARRLREVAFFPVFTPSLIQLRLQLQQLGEELGLNGAPPPTLQT